MQRLAKINPSYFRNAIFGAEDSLVSTVGVLFGVATAQYDQKLIVTTGFVLIAVEALSMGAGAYLSEESTHEVSGEKTANAHISGVIMFFSYFISGFLPILPYIFIPNPDARYISVVIALLSLFVLGWLPQKNVKSGIRMMLVAGTAVLIGFIIGNIFHTP